MAEWGRLITAKIIATSRYMRNTPKRSATDLVKYMGTREGVEKMAEEIDNSPATVRQQRLVQDILKFDSASQEYGEYQDYENSPTKSNASEFIDAFIERNADRVGELDKLVSYMAERPGVEKLGAHGLFSQTDDKIDLDSVAEEVGQHKGIIWTHVISLHREDAERLAMKIMDVEHSQNFDAGGSIQSVVSALCKLISKSYDKRVAQLNTQIDSKLRSKIEQKKAAHGLKTERSIQQNMDDDEVFGMRM